MTITNDQIYALNKMNATSNKVQLGNLIRDAESVTPGEIALADGKILVGNASNIATAVTMSGAATLSNTGVLTLSGGSGFAVLAGQAGGQILTGGTADVDKLTLKGTANATKKGAVQIDSGSTFLLGTPASAALTLYQTLGVNSGTFIHAVDGSEPGTIYTKPVIANVQNGSATEIEFHKSRGGSFGTLAYLNNGDNMGGVAFCTYNGTYPGEDFTARIGARASENHSLNVHGATLRFETTPNGSTTRNVVMELFGGGDLQLTQSAGRLNVTGFGGAAKALVSDSSKNIQESAVTGTELGFLAGVTSAVQTQLNGMAQLAGRSGGQTLDGDTLTGGSLLLGSTFHSTKGFVKVQDGSDLMVGDGSPDVITSGFSTPTGGKLYLTGTSVASRPILQMVGGTANSGPLLYLTHSQSGTGTLLAPANASTLGTLAFRGWISGNVQGTSGGQIQAVAEEAWGVGAAGARLVFQTTPIGSTTSTPRLFITNSGEINIRTASGGNLVWATDNANDIGAAGATRPRTAYIGTSVVAPLVSMASNGQSTSIQGSASASASVAYKLPPADGTSGFVLTTDGAAVTSWAPAAPDPVVLSDVQATRVGLKEYLHGVTYNNSSGPTVTGSAFTVGGTVWTVTRGVFVPYQMQDGTWRLHINIVGTVDTATSTATLTVNDIVFKNTAAFYQACTSWWGVMFPSRAYADPNTANIITDLMGATDTTISVSADVELNAKPNWAY